MKTCGKCHAVKENTEFGQRGARGGLQSYCRDCKKMTDKLDRTNDLQQQCATLPFNDAGKHLKRKASRTSGS